MERALWRVLHLILIFSLLTPTVSGVVEARPPDADLSPDAPLAQVTTTPEPTQTSTSEPIGTATPVPTLEPTTTLTDTTEPTGTATAAATDTVEPTATDTSEPTSTASPAPTETATPAPTPSATPTLDPTVTVTPTEPGLTVNLSVSPASASVGDVVTFTAQVHNGGASDLPWLSFSDDVPAGLTFLPESNPAITYDPTQNILTTTLPALAPGDSTALSYAFQVSSAGAFPETLLTNAASIIEAQTGTDWIAAADLLLAAPDQSGGVVDEDGGWASSDDGRVTAAIPAAELSGEHFVLFAPGNETAGEGYTVQVDLLAVVGTAQNGDGEPIDATRELTATTATFDQPVTLAFNLDGFADLAHLPGKWEPYVTTYDEGSGVWVRLPDVAVDPARNVLAVQTTHLSQWGAGVGPNSQALLFSNPGPSLFTGAARFSYPIWTPPIAGGMKPGLALNYSSSTADGVLTDTQAAWTGFGWTLSSIEVAREINNGNCSPCGDGGNPGTTYGYTNDFILLFNGAGYPLIKSESDNARYYTQDQSFLYIIRHNPNLGNDQGVANTTKEWWEVKSQDGTIYRLGWNTDSEQLANMKGYSPSLPGGWAALGYAGQATDRVANRWRVDQVTDVHGNLMTTTYAETARTANGVTYDQASYPTTIAYRPYQAASSPYSVNFGRVSRNGFDQPGAGELKDWTQWDTDQLATITVRANITGTTVDVRKYVLDYATDHPDTHETLMLAGITEQGWAADGSFASLPRIGFTYAHYINRQDCTPSGDCKQWVYPRLTNVSNGYGGAAAYVYGTDGRTSGEWWLSYRVETVTVSDGMGNPPLKTTYAYSDLKYEGSYSAAQGWWSNDHHNSPSEFGPGWPNCYPGNPTTGSNCTYPSLTYDEWLHTQHGHVYSAHWNGPNWPNWSYTPVEGGGGLLGYGTVTETRWAFDGVTKLSITPHKFHTRGALPSLADTPTYVRQKTPFAPLAGREYETTYQDGSGTALNRTTTTFTDYDDLLTSGKVHFVYAAAVTNTTFYGAAQLDARTEFVYDTNYGNLTGQIEYDQAGQPYRQTTQGYTPNTTQWIIGKPSWENNYRKQNTGESCSPGNGWCRVGATWYIYDGKNADDFTMGTKGNLTGLRRWDGTNYVDTKFGYDTWGNQITQTTFSNLGTATTWASQNPATITTTYDSTARAYPTLVTNTIGFTSTTAYDLRIGVPLTVTDANNAVTGYRYDAFGRLTKVFAPGDSLTNPTEQYNYTDGLAPFKIETLQCETSGNCSANNRPILQFYDGLGRLIQTRAETANGSQQSVTTQSYGPLGVVVSSTVPQFQTYGTSYVAPNWTTVPKSVTQYDALGRATTITAPDGTLTTHSYGLDIASVLTYTPTNLLRHVVIDANNHARQEITDVFGRVIKVRELSGSNTGPDPWAFYAETRYGYDVLDHLTYVTNTVNTTTVITYNILGQKTGMIDPDMGRWIYTYTVTGTLGSQTDARGCTINFTYDKLSRLTKKTYAGPGSCDSTPDVTYTYDSTANGNYGKGQRTGMSDANATTSWKYDQRGRVISETQVINGAGGGTFITQWAYDAMERVTSMTYPGGAGGQPGEVVTFGYGAHGLLNSVAGASTYVQSITYDAAGRVDVRLLSGGLIKQDHDYFAWTTPNGQGRLQYLKVGTPTNLTSLQALTYTYDAVGNVLTIQDGNAGGTQTQTFTYDFLDRLKTAATSGGGTEGPYAITTTINAIGNITSKTGLGVYTYGASASGCTAGTPATKPHAVASTSGQTSYTYSYDCNGNITQRNIGSTYNLTYDAENRLTGVSGAATATFVYDGDGQRVKGTVGGVTTAYVGNWYEWTGSTAKKYYSAGGARIAMNDAGTVRYLLGDHLGSTSITADTAGVRVAELMYKAWGENRYAFSTTPTTFRYTGQRQESGLGGADGLYFYQARWYDPMISRFTQADTVVPGAENPQSLNRYSYTLGNPLKYTDPSGHCVLGLDTAICAHIALALMVDLIARDIAEDGRFDTPDNIRTTVSVAASVVTGNPFRNYRDPNLASNLASKSSPDLTSWLESTMKANASGSIAATLRQANAGGADDKIAAYLGWAAMVKGGAPWDYKVELRERSTQSVILAGHEFNIDVVANIHFGYVGRASGFSADELLVGAGVAQILAGTSDWAYWQSYFDDPQDQFAIWLGIWLYEHPDMALEDAIEQYGDNLNAP